MTTAPTTVRPPEALPLGIKLHRDRFNIGKVLGRGGYGITYLGNDHQLGRIVALKELFPVQCVRQNLQICASPDFTDDELQTARQKFLDEARTLARFRHDGIVQVFDCFEENNTAYLVMEYLQGQTLQQLVEERGALPPHEALAFITTVGSALQEVHGAHIIHRDIKPENIIVCAPDTTNNPTPNTPPRVVLIDFGLNKQVASSTTYGTQKLTHTTALGSPGYAAPEQYGQGGNLGIATDIYGLAATFYYLLTAHVPLSAVERINETLPPPHAHNPAVPLHVSEAVLRAMSLTARERPTSIADWLQQLSNPTPTTPTHHSSPITHHSRNGTPAPTTVLTTPAPAPTHYSSTPQPAPYATPARPLSTQHSNLSTAPSAPAEVRVSARVLHWPLICACCGGNNTAIAHAVQTNRQGQRFVRGNVAEWAQYLNDLYCHNCRHHFQLEHDIARKIIEIQHLESSSHAQIESMRHASRDRLQSETLKLNNSIRDVDLARRKTEEITSSKVNLNTITVVGLTGFAIGTILANSAPIGMLVGGGSAIIGEIGRTISAARTRDSRLLTAQSKLAAAQAQAQQQETHLQNLRHAEALRLQQYETDLRTHLDTLKAEVNLAGQQMAGATQSTCTCNAQTPGMALTASYGSQHTFRFTNPTFAREFQSLNHDKLMYTT